MHLLLIQIISTGLTTSSQAQLLRAGEHRRDAIGDAFPSRCRISAAPAPLAGTVQEVRPARAGDRRLQLIQLLLQFDQRLTDLLH